MSLTNEQEEQLKRQYREHQHDTYRVDIELGDGEVLRDFVVRAGVLRPEKMTAVVLARWLFENKDIYHDKAVLDMGSGSGIQGVVCGLYGAKNVVFSDIADAPVRNTKGNVVKFGLEDRSEVVQGDLFEGITGKFDVIIFNHPFFAGHFEGDKGSVYEAWRGDVGVLHRFFDTAKGHLSPGGMLIMPYFHIAGPDNDPEVQIKKHPEYSLEVVFRGDIDTDLHKGSASIYKIKLCK